MGTRTRIVWADSTASPWTGCTPVSAGCDGCYARTLALRWGWCREWGAGAPRHRFAGFELAVMAMERKAAAAGGVCVDCGGYVSGFDCDCPCGQVGACGQLRRPRVFPSLCDWLDPEVPSAWLANLLGVIDRSPHLDWMLLTKRPGLWKERMIDSGILDGKLWVDGLSPKNVWIGATVENQEAADQRVPELLRIPAARRFVSVEPMLGPVDIIRPVLSVQNLTFPHGFSGWTEGSKSRWFADTARAIYIANCKPRIDWVICGGESGPKARPMHPDWVRNLRDQCVAAGVSFTFKQWGEWQPLSTMDGRQEMPFGSYDVETRFGFLRVGAKRAGRLLDGRTWDGKDEEEKAGPIGTCRDLSGDGKDTTRRGS